MKTFKIVALHILDGDDIKDIPLTDGLIINKEDRSSKWIIEAFIDKEYLEFFQEELNSDEKMEIRVIITHAANDPAPFTVRVLTINVFDHHISVLFEGKLSKMRNEYATLILSDLLEEGLEGEQLLEEFKARIKSKRPSPSELKTRHH